METARSALECHLYISLHPCVCGDARSDFLHRLVLVDNALCSRYHWNCLTCGTVRTFVFLLHDEIPRAEKFGGKRVSTLVDAGQYLNVADLAAEQVEADTIGRPAEARGTARMLMSRATAAIEEVLKWIPENEDHMPARAFFTEDGRVVRDREPGRFQRARLESVLKSYCAALAALS